MTQKSCAVGMRNAKLENHLKGQGHDTYDEKVYVPDEDSLEQRMNIFHGQLYSLYRDNRKFRLPLQLLFLIKSRSDS